MPFPQLPLFKHTETPKLFGLQKYPDSTRQAGLHPSDETPLLSSQVSGDSTIPLKQEAQIH